MKERKKTTGQGAIIGGLLKENIIAMALASLSFNITSVINNIIIGHFLPEGSLAAFGLISPISSYLFFGLAGVIGSGFQNACAKAIGKRENEEAGGLFSIAIWLTLGISVLVAAAMLLGVDGVVTFLGADEALFEGTKAYLSGWLIGAPAFMLQVVLQYFVRLEGDTKCSVAGAVVISVAGVLGGLLSVFVLDGGMFGIALASSISNYLSVAVLASHFFKKTSILHLRAHALPWGRLLPSLSGGLPSLVSRYSLMAQSICLNWLLMAAGGSIAVAAKSVWKVWYSYAGAFESAAASTVMLLASTMYGERNRSAMQQMMRASRRAAFLLNGAMALVTILAAPWIVRLFMGGIDAEQLRAAVACLRIMALSMPVYSLCSIYEKYFQGISRIGLAAVYCFITEFGVVVPLCWAFGKALGLGGVWIGYVAACAAALGVAELLRLALKTDRLFLPKNFSVPPEDTCEFNIYALEDVSQASICTSEFCAAHGIDARRSMILALCVEELARNSVVYGFKKCKNGCVCLRLVYQDGSVTVHLNDNCPRFDPEAYYSMAVPKNKQDNIGIYMVFHLAKEVKYVPLLNRNTVLIHA